jgi:exodeoxyribonuclease VII large subunit
VSDLFDLPFEEPGPEPEPDAPAAPDRTAAPISRRVFTVSELTGRIRELLETTFLEVWVEGEISNSRQWTTGHLYFTLKDEGAQLKAIMFRTALRYLRFTPEDGLRVLARGRIGVYEPKGEYQIVCEHLEPHGFGALQLAFDQVKKRLQGEGLFDAARKRPLPALPRKIGVVTSLEGAALRDIVKVLVRRYPNAHLIVRPTRVQGEGAAAEVARAMAAIGKVPGVDVIIVGRGGGSIEDLWAFNEEIVARAIAAAPVPVISAVGHETDVTIADFVADLRAPTPSAAAEMVVARKDDYCGRVDRLAERLSSAARAAIQRRRQRIHELTARPAVAGWPTRLALRGRHAAELTHDLRRVARALLARRARAYQSLRQQLETYDLRRRLGGLRARLLGGEARLREAALRRRHLAESRLGSAAGRLDSLSPLAVLARGYAVCWNEARTMILRDSAALEVGDRVRVELASGEIGCVVHEKNDKPQKSE